MASTSSSTATSEAATKKMSLDQFMAVHTSEDNESFNEIQEEQFRKFRVDKAWMFKENEKLSIEMKSEELVLPSIEEQVGNPAIILVKLNRIAPSNGCCRSIRSIPHMI